MNYKVINSVLPAYTSVPKQNKYPNKIRINNNEILKDSLENK